MLASPIVSIVTPSLQQVAFIERTLASVASQGIGALAGRIEHLVMDGGSTDGTVDILQRWSDRVVFSSAADAGQTAAINEGLVRSRGEILGYLNSDDVYRPGAVAAAVAAFARDPTADVVYGDADHVDAEDRILGAYPTEDWSLDRLKLHCFLCQPAVFFRRSVLSRFGPLDPQLHYCMDYEYWLRLSLRGARFVRIRANLAASRIHPATKTARAPEAAHAETNGMLKRHLGRVPDSWLANYAYAVLDEHGVARDTGGRYLARVAFLSALAAFRWNRLPSVSLARMIGSWLLHRSTAPAGRWGLSSST